MKKIVLILMFVFICFSFSSAQEENSITHVEFLIGGGTKTSIFSEILNGTFIGPGFGVGIMFPVSFTLYVNKYFGIGFVDKAVFSYASYLEFNGMLLCVDNDLSMVNKIGNNEKKKFLLLEYGLLTSGRFYILYDGQFSSNFYIGPNIFIGYENRSRTNTFAFSVGGFFDTRIYCADMRNSNGGYVNDYILSTGVEFRWRYCYFK